MTASSDVERLRSELQRVKWAGIGGIILVAIASFLFFVRLRRPAPTELDVQRINVIDPDGTVRLVISNTARFPPPKLAGKEYARSVSPAGMVFYDTKGSELGGIAITDTEKTGRLSALAFDYPNNDAMGFLTLVSPDGKSATAGLMINSRPPSALDLPAAAKVSERRVAIHNRDENAEILLADPKGHDRIRLRVDPEGDASIEILDDRGAVVFRAPERKP